jgi:hypothetical protein
VTGWIIIPLPKFQSDILPISLKVSHFCTKNVNSKTHRISPIL